MNKQIERSDSLGQLIVFADTLISLIYVFISRQTFLIDRDTTTLKLDFASCVLEPIPILMLDLWC